MVPDSPRIAPERTTDMHALHQLIPMAVGMLISPLPIVAVVAILLSSRGRTAAPAYTLSFTAVNLGFVTIGTLTTVGSTATSSGSAIVVLVLTIVLTLGFAALSLLSWLTRPKPGAPPRLPAWLAAVDTITPVRAAGLGFLMAVTNSKNIPLELKGGALIGEAHVHPALTIVLCVGFAIAGSLALIVPTLLSATGSERVARGLDRLKSEMIAHNAVIMTVLFAILAANEAAHLLHQLTA